MASRLELGCSLGNSLYATNPKFFIYQVFSLLFPSFHLLILKKRYVGGILDLFIRGDVGATGGGSGGGGVKTNPFTPMVAIPAINMVSTLCALLDGLLVQKNCPPEGPKEIVEPYFIFACIWAFGGPLSGDKVGTYDASGRDAFSNWFRRTWIHSNIPDDGLFWVNIFGKY